MTVVHAESGIGNAEPCAAGLQLRPALVNGQRIHLGCPPWCTEDHVAANERHLEDVLHTSGCVDLMAPRWGRGAELLLLSQVIAADAGTPEERQPQVTVDVGDVSGMYLTPDEADRFADGLMAFALRVRSLARTARGI